MISVYRSKPPPPPAQLDKTRLDLLTSKYGRKSTTFVYNRIDTTHDVNERAMCSNAIYKCGTENVNMAIKDI